tara:strand:- start:400 stop:558 length:159 start_codon:yes stop_codon:yes gene_type:complete
MYMKEDDNKPGWLLEIGRYPGILFGFRSYEEKDFVTHVLYVPFIDIAFTKYL